MWKPAERLRVTKSRRAQVEGWMASPTTQQRVVHRSRIVLLAASGAANHLIRDNYQTHKHPQVRRWLERHQRFRFHFIPTSSSWLNLVERWLRELTAKAIRRGAFPGVPALVAAIYDYIEHNNRDPQPLVWTATADQIIAKVSRGKAKLETLH